MSDASGWRRCSACKTPIQRGATYWVCSVSTCNRKRTGLAFCTVSCWEVHLPGANHREAWALERTAPTEGAVDEAAPERRRRRIVQGAPRVAAAAAAARAEPEAAREILVIASRLKEYVRATSGMNTSDRVLEPLSDILRRLCDEAVRNASREGRRTVLDRDVPRV